MLCKVSVTLQFVKFCEVFLLITSNKYFIEWWKCDRNLVSMSNNSSSNTVNDRPTHLYTVKSGVLTAVNVKCGVLSDVTPCISLDIPEVLNFTRVTV